VQAVPAQAVTARTITPAIRRAKDGHLRRHSKAGNGKAFSAMTKLLLRRCMRGKPLARPVTPGQAHRTAGHTGQLAIAHPRFPDRTHLAAWREPQQRECDLASRQSGGSGQGLVCWPRPGSRYGKTPRHRRSSSSNMLVARPFSIWSDRPRNAAMAGCPPTVSAADGHGMILTGRRVDAEDATYRVARAGLSR
jgi:hypothetical protein